jgi:hypothetical protein
VARIKAIEAGLVADIAIRRKQRAKEEKMRPMETTLNTAARTGPAAAWMAIQEFSLAEAQEEEILDDDLEEMRRHLLAENPRQVRELVNALMAQAGATQSNMRYALTQQIQRPNFAVLARRAVAVMGQQVERLGLVAMAGTEAQAAAAVKEYRVLEAALELDGAAWAAIDEFERQIYEATQQGVPNQFDADENTARRRLYAEGEAAVEAAKRAFQEILQPERAAQEAAQEAARAAQEAARAAQEAAQQAEWRVVAQARDAREAREAGQLWQQQWQQRWQEGIELPTIIFFGLLAAVVYYLTPLGPFGHQGGASFKSKTHRSKSRNKNRIHTLKTRSKKRTYTLRGKKISTLHKFENQNTNQMIMGTNYTVNVLSSMSAEDLYNILRFDIFTHVIPEDLSKLSKKVLYSLSLSVESNFKIYNPWENLSKKSGSTNEGSNNL